MLRRSFFVGLIVMILSLPGRSEWVSLKNRTTQPAPPVVTVLQDDQVSTVLKIDVSGFVTGDLFAEGKSYQSVDLLTEVVTGQVGSPEIPYVTAMLAIPDRGGVTVEVVERGELQKFSGYILPPSRPSWEEGSPEPGYVENEAAYRSMGTYPETEVSIGEPVVLRDFRIARVAIYPVHYTPATKEVQITSSITIRVRYGNENGVNPKTGARRAIAPSFGAVYRSSLVNYENVLNREFRGMEDGREVLLCIVPDTFATAFKPYAEWKHKTGTYVKVTKFSEIGATSTNPDIIKNYIGQCYHTWQYPPTYILLVGDYGQVPKKAADGQSFANEDYFVEIDGNDVFPEMFIGRFTHQVNSQVGLQIIVNKLIKYERFPYRANQDWFKHAVVCANNAYYTQPDTKRWVSTIMTADGGFVVDTLLNLWHGPCVHNLTQVTSAINNGRSFLNYRGEGGSAGWWASCYQFGTSDVTALNNGEKLPFVTSIGCGVAMFDVGSGNCFGEEWMEIGTPTSSRGACAFVGPTWGNTHTKYNNAIDKGLYVAMFQEGMETPAQTLLRGKIRMYDLYGGGDSQVLWHFRTYTVLGDPSIHVWKAVPRKTDITYTSQVSVGYDQVQVTVLDSATHAPVGGAQVCIAGDSVYVVGVTDASGLAIIPVTSPSIDTLTIVVRGGDVVPAEGTIVVISDQEHVAPLGDPVVTDIDGNLDGRVNPNEHIQISYTLRNWGTQPSTNVQATLSAHDTTYVGVVNPGPVSFGTLVPNGSGTGSGTPLQFYVKTTTPVGSLLPLRLNVTSSSRSWNYATSQEVFGCNLQYAAMSINDQGSPQGNGRLDPGETAILYLTIINNGQDVAPNVAGVLRGTTPYIRFVDSVGSFGTLAVGASSTNTTNYFIVTAADSCPVGSTFTLTVLLSTQNGNYSYSISRDFSVTVGLPSGTDPTGPDAYGYYAYSSDDSTYEQAPKFEWVEIRSVGTRVPWATTGDFTTTATLPFTFRYYGRNYSNVRVSSDGWLAFGSGTQTSYTNYALPHSDNITNMVALFWDDLFEGSNNPTSKLLYYSDAANHRFIVEWDSVGHYSGTTLRESFQAVLLDPAYYPTPTGDGELFFQYRIIGEETACTVGMEDSTQSIGIQYLFNGTYDPTATDLRDGLAIRFSTQPPSIASTNITVSVPIGAAWNLLSNPVLRHDSLNTVRQLYPHCLSDYAFRYDPLSGYIQTSVMPNGPGFWAKFPAGELNSITGARIVGDTVSVSAGWNILGSISTTVDTSTITTSPAGLRTSSYFGYSDGYFPVTHLDPGRGYWVKANGTGEFMLHQTVVNSPRMIVPGVGELGGMNTMTISDSRGGSQTLYFGSSETNTLPLPMFEMPPPPPVGAFDARFESLNGGTILKTHPKDSKCITDLPILVQSVAYPLTVGWNIIDGGRYQLMDATGAHVLARTLEGAGSMKTGSGSIQKMILRAAGSEDLPADFALSQNFPNPFNPTTVIKYALPIDSHVSLRVFNILGQEVSTLVNEVQRAGYKSVRWDSKTGRNVQVASGVYFLRLDAAGANGSVFSQLRKMLLMK